MKKRNWIIGVTLFFLLAVLVLRPVPTPDEKDCLVLKGTVTSVSEGGVNDVVFRLEGSTRSYYINRGLEKGLDLEKLNAMLIDREIIIKYPKYWTPLDPNNAVRHISKLEYSGQTIYTELKD